MASENAADGSSRKRKLLSREEEREKGRLVKQQHAEVDAEEDLVKADEKLEEAWEASVDVLDPGVNISEAKTFRRLKEKQMKQKQVSALEGHFDGKELMVKMVQMFSKAGVDAGIDWERLDTEAAKFFAATPSAGLLSHSLCKDVKPKKPRNVAQREKQPVVNQKPSYEYNEAEADKQNAMNRYRQMAAVVAGLEEPIPVAKLVMDPKSFEESVYNYFTLTSLINDHKAAMDVKRYKAEGDQDAQDTMMVRPPNPELRKTQSENQDMGRRIDRLGISMWLQNIKRHNITKAGFRFNLDLDSTQNSQANTQVA